MGGSTACGGTAGVSGPDDSVDGGPATGGSSTRGCPAVSEGSSRRAASTRPRSSAASRVARRVKAIRWSAVRFERTARTQSAGSSRLRSAPAMRQISRSGRSIRPTVHVTPTDSARALV